MQAIPFASTVAGSPGHGSRLTAKPPGSGVKRHDRLYPATAAAIREDGFYTNGLENCDGLVRTTVCTWSAPDGSFFSGNSFWVSRLADGWYLGTWGAQYYRLPDENRIIELCLNWCRRFPRGTYSDFDEQLKQEFGLIHVSEAELNRAIRATSAPPLQ